MRSRRLGVKIPPPVVDLPMLFHWGRQDNAVGFYGCKITPEDIQHVILRVPALGERVTNFALHPYEDADANKCVEIWFEVSDDGNDRWRPTPRSSVGRVGRGESGLPRVDQDGAVDPSPRRSNCSAKGRARFRRRTSGSSDNTSCSYLTAASVPTVNSLSMPWLVWGFPSFASGMKQKSA